MPEQKVGRETVLDAALGLLRERGETALSARTVAERAGCSVQPIYSLFGDMRGLVHALYDHARALYLHMIVYTHGMAAMLVAGAQFSDEELGERLNEAFTGLLTLVR